MQGKGTADHILTLVDYSLSSSFFFLAFVITKIPLKLEQKAVDFKQEGVELKTSDKKTKRQKTQNEKFFFFFGVILVFTHVKSIFAICLLITEKPESWKKKTKNE